MRTGNFVRAKHVTNDDEIPCAGATSRLVSIAIPVNDTFSSKKFI